MRASFGFCLLLLAGCASFGTDDELEPPPAEVLRVEVTPERVAPGDTARVRVFTSRRVVQHTWTFSEGRAAFRSGRDTISWVAPKAPGVYQHAVSLTESLFTLDREEFLIEVAVD